MKDFPEHKLLAKDLVTPIEYLESPEPGVSNGYYVEAFNAIGKTIAVFIVEEDALEPLTEHDVFSKRTLETA
ncbi:hypothetical protein [Spirosoma montaniterrae]|uniref:hypothetical protein n=1 Tax=Spirosoma montaniterrae TaxID=1178516 RepID=UPI0018DE0D9E|nr:hypothetical protein [Spirosoma montaniterrae]